MGADKVKRFLKHVKQNDIFEINNIEISDSKLNDQDKSFTTTDDQNLSIKKTISQIKNISQEEKTPPKTQLNEIKGKIEIKDFDLKQCLTHP